VRRAKLFHMQQEFADVASSAEAMAATRTLTPPTSFPNRIHAPAGVDDLRRWCKVIRAGHIKVERCKQPLRCV
jgi:hypothetical protein